MTKILLYNPIVVKDFKYLINQTMCRPSTRNGSFFAKVGKHEIFNRLKFYFEGKSKAIYDYLICEENIGKFF